MSRVQLARSSISLPNNLFVQHEQRLSEIAGRSRYDELRFAGLVQHALHPLQLVLVPT